MIPTDFKGAALLRSSTAIASAAATIPCGADIVQAVIDVETSGSGYLSDGRPKILCERHHFHSATGGRFDASHPQISSATPGGYSGGAAEYARLAIMISLDRRAGLESTSWGLPQIMGSNHALAGYPDAESMVAAFCNSEDQQIMAFAAFIRGAGLADELQRNDATAFAKGYNGPGYAVNQYDKKIVADLAKIRAAAASAPGQAWPPARAFTGRIQAALNLHGYGPIDPDGWLGPKTAAAIGKFQRANGLAETSIADAATSAALVG